MHMLFHKKLHLVMLKKCTVIPAELLNSIPAGYASDCSESATASFCHCLYWQITTKYQIYL